MKRMPKIIFLTLSAGLSCMFCWPGLLSAAGPAYSLSCPEHGGHSATRHVESNTSQQESSKIMAVEKQVETQCSSCHGVDGKGVSDNIPNLAGQEPMYLCGWLAGCREQGDQCSDHEDIAAQFTNQQLLDFAEYYSHLPAEQW
jgi:cytochrome c553